MNRILLILLFIVLPVLFGGGVGGEVFSQSALPKAVNDSLWAVWNNPNEASTSRLKAIHTLAWDGYVFSQPDSALHFAQMELDHAKKTGPLKFEAMALGTQGIAYYMLMRFDMALEHYKKSVKIWEKTGDLVGLGKALGNLGVIHNALNNPIEEIECYSLSLKILKEIGDKNGAANALVNIGNVYRRQGNHAKAIDYCTQGLRIHEELGDKSHVADDLNSIGAIYAGLSNHQEAIDKYYLPSLSIQQEIGDITGSALTLINIAGSYYEQGDRHNASGYYLKSLEICKKTSDRQGLARCYNGLGVIYNDQGDFEKALEFHKLSLGIRKEIGDTLEILHSIINLSIAHRENSNYKEAISFGENALKMAQKFRQSDEVKHAAEALYKSFKKLNQPQKALEMHELYIQMRDSIDSEENQKEVMRQQFQYDYEKKELAIQKEMELSALKHEYEKKQAAARTEKEKQQLRYEEELKRTQIEATYAQRQAAMKAEQKQKDALAKAEQDKKDAIATEQLRRKNQQRNAFIGGFALTLGLAGVSYRSYRRKKRDNTIITAQKEVVEKKNHAILESITYARKLQEAVLPPPKVVKEFFSDSFLLYLPRDIVSGDFYWMENLPLTLRQAQDMLPSQGGGNVSLFALGDCTGHGVPGAMLSVMGLNGLNRALNELHITQPADFLTQLTKDLHDAFQRSDSMVRDGMDLSICALDSTNRKLTYAGANNPLWIARKGEIIVHKPNKRPVGHHDMEGEGFSQITIDLQEGDTIYLMTDGYADQLGGPNGLKMMTKVFRERLASLSTLPLPKQREQLIADLDAWKGSGSQTDDVCVMGVRV